MKSRIFCFCLCLVASMAGAQGVFVPQQTALKSVNGLTTPIANATITVCAANAGGIPCSPALTNTIFKDAALTLALSNPFTADAQGNYQFAVAPGTYTVTVTALGFNGNSYQVTAGSGGSGGGGGGTTWPTITGGVSNSQTFTLGSSNFNLGGTGGVDLSLGNPLTALKWPIGASAAPTALGIFAYDSTANDAVFGNGTTTIKVKDWGTIYGPGPNTKPLQMGSGGSLSPTSSGQIAATQAWMTGGIVDPVLTGNGSGGSLPASTNIGVKVSYNTVLGETVASRLISVSTPAGCGVSCSMTVTAPTLPSWAVSYNVYSCSGVSCTGVLKQTAANACVAITGNCIIQTVGAGAAPLTVQTGFVQPANTQASLCPPSVIPSWFVQDTSGNFQTQAGVDPFADNTNGPPSPGGTLTFCRRVFFNDTLLSPPGGKNSFLTVRHRAGTGTVVTNQDRGIAILEDTATGDTTQHYGLEGIQSELDTSFAAGGGINGSPDGEAAAGSFQLNDSSTAGWAAGPFGASAIRAHFFKTGAGTPDQGGAVNALVGFSNATTTGGIVFPAYRATCATSVGLVSGTACAAMVFQTASGGFQNGQLALYIPNGGALTPGTLDYLIRNDVHNYKSVFNGPISVTSITQGDPAALTVGASLSLTGGMSTTQIGSGWTAVPGPPSCTGGASTYNYVLVGVTSGGGTVNSATMTSVGTCTNPLTPGNPVTIVPGAGLLATYTQVARIDVYRTGGPMGTGKIATLTCLNDVLIFGCNNFLDTGLAATTALPSGNSTGDLNLAGPLTTPLYNSTTNCAAVGTAASPSVASCTAAPAGSFSCATNATGATCTVNTTAVTANSQIFVQEDETLGTRLGVTCNTGTNVLPASRLLAARSAGVSFTINLGTVTTNPACFSYYLIN